MRLRIKAFSMKLIRDSTLVFLSGFALTDIVWHKVAFFEKCSGHCMEPTIRDGDYVVVYRIADPFNLKGGEIVVFTDPEFPKEQSCKRVIENGLINKNRLSKLHFDYWDQLKAWKIKLNSGYVWVEDGMQSMETKALNPGVSVELATLLEFIQTRKLSELVHDALTIVANRLSANVPERFATVLKSPYFISFVLSTIDLQFLVAHDATFAEKFYGLQKVSSNGILSKTRVLLAYLVFERIVPLISDWLQNENSQLLMSRISDHLNFDFKFYLLYLKSSVVVANSLFALTYLLESSNYPSLNLFLSRFFLITSIQNQNHYLRNSNKFRTVFSVAHSTSKVILKLHTVISFFIQFRDFWSAQKAIENEQKDVTAERIPPLPIKEDEIKRSEISCNSCGKTGGNIINPVASELCGHVFCLTCVKNYLIRFSKCPKCALGCNVKNLVKLIDL